MSREQANGLELSGLRRVNRAARWIPTEGAPALYGYITGIQEAGGVGNEVYFDNVRVTLNKK